jgi:hypothetical protein
MDQVYLNDPKLEAFLAVASLLHVLVATLVQRVDDDAAHRARVVNYEEAHADILCDPDGDRASRFSSAGGGKV